MRGTWQFQPGKDRLRLTCIAIGLALSFVLTGLPSARAQVPVDLQLVLAIDSSSSVDMDEYYLQLEGYAAAFRHPELLKAIQSGPNKAIAVAMFEWSGPKQQQVNFDWRVLADAAGLEAFARELSTAPRLVIGGETAIGAAIDFGVDLFEHSGVAGGRRVIDVSGDGASNRGRPVTQARDEAVFLGITLNGLAILNEEAGLDDYYRVAVIGGTGAFVIAARDYTDFADAILRKLLREITTITQRLPDDRLPEPHQGSRISLNRFSKAVEFKAP
ncbi:MAG: DUF1194 domain-containing protein [Proteobacteria bacterium]|nr:DUF1194 domain-containing protein [Pseudomonadota bacterium]